MDIFKFAMKMEKSGEVYYRDLAQKAATKKVRILFQDLAEDELRHRNVLEEMSEKYRPEIVDSKILDTSKDIFEWVRAEKSEERKIDSETEAYAMALEIESKSVAFYKEKAKESNVPVHKKAFLQIAGQEQMHFDAIQALIQSIEETKKT